MDGLASCTYGSITLQFIFCFVFYCHLILVALSAEDGSDANVSPKIFITVISSSKNKGKLIGTLTNSPKVSLRCGLINWQEFWYLCVLFILYSHCFLSTQQSLELHLFNEFSHRKYSEDMGRWWIHRGVYAILWLIPSIENYIEAIPVWAKA